jgi:hypothetical protein
MALLRYSSASFSTASGVGIANGATITVRVEASGSLASIYSDRDGATPKSNPFTADSKGRFDFFVEPIDEGFEVSAVFGAETTTVNNVLDLIPFTPSGSGRSRSVQDVLRDTVLLTNYAVCDGTTDDSSAVLQAISDLTEGGTIICPPGKVCLVDPDTFTHSKHVNFVCPGSGHRSNTQSKPSFTFKASAGGAYLYKFSNLQTDIANLKHSMRFDGIAFHGGGFTFTDAVVAIEGVSLLRMPNCSISSATGSALRLRLVYEPDLDMGIFNIDASGESGVIVIDDRYNSDNLLNVNNFHFRGQVEANQGVLFFAHETSNLDHFEVTGTKFEWGLGSVPSGGPWSVFEIRQAARVNIHANGFVNFKNANKYDIFFEMGHASTTCAFAIHDNDFAGVDSSTIGLRAIGNARGDFYDNRCISSSNVTPSFDIESTQRVSIEPMLCLDDGLPQVGSDSSEANIRLAARASAAGVGFVSAHELAKSSGINFVVDADARNRCGTVLESDDSAFADIARIPVHLLTGYPASIRLGVRCKSASGAGVLNLGVNATNLGDKVIGSSYEVVWYDITNTYLDVLGDGSDQFRVKTGTGNAEAVYVDGIYIIPMPHHYTASAAINPAELVDGAGTAPATIAVTGAALGDFVRASYSLDLQGIDLQAWVSAADTVSYKFQNETGSTINLGTGTLTVRVEKA